MAQTRIAKTGDLVLLSTAKKKQRQGGSCWGYGSRNCRPCQLCKKMPGTDFVCDGFMYGAILMLTKNNFVTQFTRITMVVTVNLGTLESFTAL